MSLISIIILKICKFWQFSKIFKSWMTVVYLGGGPRGPGPPSIFFIYVKIIFYQIFQKKIEKSLKGLLQNFLDTPLLDEVSGRFFKITI